MMDLPQFFLDFETATEEVVSKEEAISFEPSLFIEQYVRIHVTSNKPRSLIIRLENLHDTKISSKIELRALVTAMWQAANPGATCIFTIIELTHHGREKTE